MIDRASELLSRLMRVGVVFVGTLVLLLGVLGCVAEPSPTACCGAEANTTSCPSVSAEDSDILGDGAWRVGLISDEPLRADWEQYSSWPEGVATAADGVTILVDDWAHGFVVWLHNGRETRRIEVDAGEVLQPAHIVADADGFLLLVNPQNRRDAVPQLWWSDDGVSWLQEDTSDGWFRAATAVEMVRRDDTIWIAGGIVTGRNVSSPTIWTRTGPGTLALAPLEDSREPVTFVSGFESTCGDLLAHGLVTLNPNLVWRLDDQSGEWKLTATRASTIDDEFRLMASNSHVTIGIRTEQQSGGFGTDEQVVAASTDSATSWERVPAAAFTVDGEGVRPESVEVLFGTSQAVWALAHDDRRSADGKVLLWTVNGVDWRYTDVPEWPADAQIIDLMERNEGLAIVTQSAEGVHLWTWSET